MTHVYALGSLLGVPDCLPIAQSALDGLTGPLHDPKHGGWYSSIGPDGPASGKTCYDHAFVLLAASTGVHAGLTGATELLSEASTTFLDHFWDETDERCADTWDTSFEDRDTYRGINANMHAVEAMLSVAGLSRDVVWLERARGVCTFVIAAAESNCWRIPEHYDEAWRPLLDYHHDQRTHQFKPYGATVGHAFEWARLFVHLANAPVESDHDVLLGAAIHLVDRAVSDGWATDGQPGFVYTTDWDGEPVVRDRLHWVLAEAIAAASVLHRQTGDPKYAEWYRTWWDQAATYHIDPRDGSWRHQLDSANRPTQTMWRGKPDLYHAFQAALIPTQPLYPMIATTLSQRRNDGARPNVDVVM